MPKAILEFELPEEKEEFDLAVKAGELQSSIDEFDNFLRKIVKYGDTADLLKSIKADSDTKDLKLKDDDLSLLIEMLTYHLRNRFWEIMNDEY